MGNFISPPRVAGMPIPSGLPKEQKWSDGEIEIELMTAICGARLGG